jgi:hypothetical protein
MYYTYSMLHQPSTPPLSPSTYLSDDPLYTPARVVESLLEPKLDAGDATDEWWTNAFNSDKTEDVSVCIEERERERDAFFNHIYVFNYIPLSIF